MEETRYLELRAREFIQLNHALAAALLLFSAFSNLSHEGHLFFSLVEIAIAAILIGATIRQRLQRRRGLHRTGHHHGGLGWLEILTGVFLAVEAWAKTRGPHHTSFIILAWIPPVILVLLGIFESRLARRFYIRITNEGLEVKLRFTRFAARWSDIQNFRREGTTLQLRKTDATVKTLKLHRWSDSSECAAWLEQQFQKHGVERA